jgi:beta-galactosidase
MKVKDSAGKKGSSTNNSFRGVFDFWNLLAFTDASEKLDCSYEIIADGDFSVQNKKLVLPSLKPLSHTVVSLPDFPDLSDYAGREVYIRFVFTAKNKELWCKKGYEVCFDQIELTPDVVTDCPQNKSSEKSDVNIKEEPLTITITATNKEFIFDRRKAQFTAIKTNGKNLLKKPLSYNFFRAPLDNDPMKEDWYKAHLNDYDIKVYQTNVRKESDGLVITAKQSFGWNIHQPFAFVESEYKIDGQGSLTVSAKLDFTTNKVSLLPRFGLRLFVDKSFDSVEYFGYGPTESYIDKHNSTWLGKFKAKVSDMYEPYIRPQENSSHYGCRYVKLSNNKLTLVCSGTDYKTENQKYISFNASHYTEEELWAKRHNFELEESGYTVFCVDYKMAGVGSNSCGPALAEKYRIQLPEVKGRLNIVFEQ